MKNAPVIGGIFHIRLLPKQRQNASSEFCFAKPTFPSKEEGFFGGARKTCVDRAAFIKNPNGGADLLVVCGPSTTPQKMPSNKK